ncbi:MAG: CoA transferase [Deltaproteobacteria bacterium]|nr:CoA transferase [Deltaproteobacteria bacterium]MBW2539774.1 CoA transferase [Deltaproteobacteria bacterium]
MTKELEGALSGYRILDLTDSRGTFCGRLLGDLGAAVIKIEKPEGGKARSIPPFAGDDPHPEKSLFFLYRNAGKKGITLNLETRDGRAIFRKLVEKADVVIESNRPGTMKELGLDYSALKQINPGLIMASITDFGQDGPYRNWKSSDLVDMAMSTAMITSGFPEGKPTAMPGAAGDDSCSLYTATSIVTALFFRGATGSGQYIDASTHETARLGIYPWGLVMWHSNVEPDKPLPPPEGRMGTMIYPIFPCKDGYVRVVALTPGQWAGLLRVIGEPEVLCTDEWKEFYYRIGNADALYALMLGFTTEFTMLELAEMGHREGVPIAPIFDIQGFNNSPQTKARGFLTEVDHPVVGKFKCPGPPYNWSETSCKIRSAAPCLGQHNKEIYCDELGYSTLELSAFKRAGII